MKHTFRIRLLIAVESFSLLFLFIFSNYDVLSFLNSLVFLTFVSLNLLMLLCGVFFCRSTAFLSFISLSFLIILFPGLVATSSDTSSETGGISIMSYNVNYLRSLLVDDEKINHLSFDTFKEHISQSVEVDILCLQETSSASYRPIAEKLDYPYYFGEKGTMIFSKFEVIEKGNLDFVEASDNSCTWLTLNVNGSRLRVYNAHLESYHFSSYWKGMDSYFNVTEKTLVLLCILFKAQKKRMFQSKIIKTHIENCPYPVVLCGDFNSPPLFSIYNTFQKEMQDVFLEKSFGLGQTFARIPGLRIDYFFLSQQLKTIQYERFLLPYSDHYPILIKIKEDWED